MGASFLVAIGVCLEDYLRVVELILEARRPNARVHLEFH